MSTKSTNPDSQLLPERYPQHDLFICDVSDAAVLKDIMQHMEHPFYSLSKKPDTKIRIYEHNGNTLKITPSVVGLATIYDKDILIYCISKIIKQIKNGEEVGKSVRLNSRELLIFTNRGTGGKDYKALIGAIDRLAGTRISTNIKTGNEEQYKTFSLIDEAEIRRKFGHDGRLLWCEIKLSDWVFNAIKANEVLTLHRDYFRLRKPIERRVYEIARKHCGYQTEWRIKLENLLKKTGSQSPIKRFRQMIRQLTKYDHLPDYMVKFNSETDMVIFTSRGEMNKPVTKTPKRIDNVYLRTETYEKAKTIAPNWDVYHIEQEWRIWLDGKELPRNPDAAFLGFCRSWCKNRGGG